LQVTRSRIVENALRLNGVKHNPPPLLYKQIHNLFVLRVFLGAFKNFLFAFVVEHQIGMFKFLFGNVIADSQIVALWGVLRRNR